MTDSDASSAFTSAPADATSAAALATQGLRYAVVDTSDEAEFGAWLRANDRGFLQASRSDEQVKRTAEGIGYRRTLGVYDDRLAARPGAADVAGWPIATLNSWLVQLTLPGSTIEHPRTLKSWAISWVTVAATHRRRGVARNLLEGELRTAAALGVPMAMLTVSESTIYGRFGFAPATYAADWTIDTRRVRWSGPAASADRIEYVSLDEYREQLPVLHDRVRLASPGEIDVWPLRWDQVVGATEPDSERTRGLRAVRYVDEGGVTRGLPLFRLTDGDDVTKHSVTLVRLDAETAEADLGLWRFLLEHDLTIELKAPLRRAEEPMRWLLGDFRAAHVDVWEHEYLRVLDVPAVYEARGYSAAGAVVFDVSDPLGFASGIWSLVVEPVETTQCATVTKLDEVPDGVAALSMSANELSAIYLGGVSVATLVAAERIAELRPGSAAAADTLLHVDRAPWLSVWF
ncbi:MAG TPA: GNAT family N-acetyltransferase [Pseudolysinimonas sp.]|nr:GNAT family N-acetyltransferase [Pseudolysinimonas sp.]